jgi:hypothetical protein
VDKQSKCGVRKSAEYSKNKVESAPFNLSIKTTHR